MSDPLQIHRDASPERLAQLDRCIFGAAGAGPHAARDAWTAADYGRLLGNPAVQGWVAVTPEGEDVGLLCFQEVAQEAEVYRIGVLPESRRRGLGRALLAHLLRAIRASGTRAVTLEVRAGNVAAIALYRALNFQESGRRPRYYADPVEDALLFRWTAESADPA